MSLSQRLEARLRGMKQQFRHSRANDVLERAVNDIGYEDVFLVSFPKSGNTWTRFLLTGLYLWKESHGEVEPNYYNIHTYVPDIHIQRVNGWRPPGSYPRIIKSHRGYTPNYARVVYVARDVRDAMISRFHFINRKRVLFADFDEFLRDPDFGVRSWVEHVNGWLDSATNAQGRLLLVRYEDLLDSPADELERVCRFMNVDADREGLEWTARMGDRARIKELEATYGRPRPAPVPFLRKGTKGQWQNDLSEAQQKYIEHEAHAAMAACGYEAS